MSAIYGIFHLNDKVVAIEDLALMQQAMSYWGPDGSGNWCAGSIGLGHLMLYNTPQSPNETLPLQSKADRFVITASARLDNRDELFQILRISPSEQSSMSDSALILKAYQKWESDCTQYLLGDWCLALWDAQNHSLFLARDHFGVSSLYYIQLDQTVVFASSLKGILSLPSIKHALNKRAIACFAPGYLHDTATPYQNVFRLAPAHSLIITKHNSKLQRYWCMEDVPELRYRSDQEYVDHFLHTYRQAVHCRLRSYRPVGTQLSSGLDSSSIAILAAQELAKSGQRLPALSSAPLHDITGLVPNARYGDESPYVKQIAEMAGNIDVCIVKSENISPLTGIRQVINILEQPVGAAASNAYWVIALLELAQQQGLGVLLSGWGGNYTVSWIGERSHYLNQLIRNRQFGTYLHEVFAWRKNNPETTWWRTIKSQALKPVLHQDWLSQSNQQRIKQFTTLNMALASSLASDCQWDASSDSSALDGLNLYFRNGIVGSIEEELGAAYGLEMRQPTMDKRLIEFCLGIPQDQYTRNGQNKLLIRRAMQGLIPNSVLWGKQRGMQAADIGQRVRCSSAEIEATLETLKTSHLAREFLNLDRMDNFFQKVQKGLNHSTPVLMSALLRGIMLGVYLQRFDDN